MAYAQVCACVRASMAFGCAQHFSHSLYSYGLCSYGLGRNAGFWMRASASLLVRVRSCLRACMCAVRMCVHASAIRFDGAYDMQAI